MLVALSLRPLRNFLNAFSFNSLLSPGRAIFDIAVWRLSLTQGVFIYMGHEALLYHSD